jgi:hypothetical protein
MALDDPKYTNVLSCSSTGVFRFMILVKNHCKTYKDDRSVMETLTTWARDESFGKAVVKGSVQDARNLYPKSRNESATKVHLGTPLPVPSEIHVYCFVQESRGAECE